MRSPDEHRGADSPNRRAEPSSKSRRDDREIKEELEQKILPLLNWIKEEHGDDPALGERPYPFCGGRLRYRIANKGNFICCQCETPDCLYLIT